MDSHNVSPEIGGTEPSSLVDRAVVDPQTLAADEVLAERLRRWSTRVTPGYRSSVSSLADAVAGNGDAVSTWLGLSPAAVIDVSEAIPDRSGDSGIVSIFEFARNALIFLPVLITWYAIGEAVGAYQRMVLEQPSIATLPFLLLWEAGFDGRIWLTLSRVATIDAFIIFSIIIVTLVTGELHRRHDSAFLGEVSEGRRGLAGVIAEATLLLNSRRPLSPLEAIDRLDSVASQMLRDLRGDRQRHRERTDRLEVLAEQLVNATNAMLRAATGLEAAERPLASMPSVMKEGLSSLSSAQIATTQAFGAANTNAMRLIQLAEPLGEALQGQRAALKAQTDASAQLSGLLGQFSSTSNALTLASNSLTQFATTEQKEQAEVFRRYVELQHSLLEALERERAEHARLTQLVIDGWSGIEPTLRQLPAYSQAIFHLTVDLERLANGLPALAEQIEQRTAGGVANQMVAASALRDASEAIAAASHRLNLR